MVPFRRSTTSLWCCWRTASSRTRCWWRSPRRGDSLRPSVWRRKQLCGRTGGDGDILM
ncbi:hypothetical protein PF004_g29008 [Phytophthora fragariae]|uniref:Uncharacterized protein n=1 Tax=Phytophthora fragariae TaxID=53985 RepID=A0A6A3HP92_9STRA|nr:hypothetical protein PF011_g26732 [Phytophthora fragariae]KAE9166890.1 hypothetical protein PF004_g29008 [Phytophthora fragariae]